MFDNIGRKIKTLATVLSGIGICFSVIFGFALLFENPVLGLLVALMGSFLSWIYSFFCYGFGELVENSAIIAGKINSSPKNNADGGKEELLDDWMKKGLIEKGDIEIDTDK